MNSRGLFSARICWRCQLRLSNSLFTSQASIPHAFRPKDARPLHNNAFKEGSKSSDPPTSKADNGINDHDINNSLEASNAKRYFYTKERKSGVWRPLQGKALTEYPLGRLHGFGGYKLREKRAKLDSDSLGKPSEVIVLQDAGFFANSLPVMEELKPAEKVDILSQLEAERGIVTQADVEKNIEYFKPKTSTISWDDFQQIQRQLVSSFTISQLAKYIDSRGTQPKEAEQQRQGSLQDGSRRAEIKQTRWMPQASGPSDLIENSQFGGYDSEAYTRKQRLVLLLLRQCWQIEAQEIIDIIGELELEIPQTEFELLIGGRDPLLQIISNNFITTQEEKIEAFRSGGIVRITARKEKAELIAREIRTLLERIYSLTIDLDVLIPEPRVSENGLRDITPKPYNEVVMSELAKLTETYITRLPSSDQISVSCIHVEPQMPLSTKADIARRLLLTSSDLANRTRTQHFCKYTSESLTAVAYHCKDGMSWHDQLHNWIRWIAPAAKSFDQSKESHITPVTGPVNNRCNFHGVEIRNTSFKPSRELPISTSLLEEGINQPTFRQKSKSSDFTNWDTSSFTETSAVVGHILYEAAVPSETSKTLVGVGPAQRATFHYMPVNISRFLSTVAYLDELPKLSLVLRFIPSPWVISGSQTSLSLPLVEMQLAVDPSTKDLELENVFAITESTASDVMLPDRPVDIRFQQRRMTRLHALGLDRFAQISEFLKASNLDLNQGRLETPPGINLPIEPHICNPKISDIFRHTEERVVHAEYIFGGLEYRSAFSFNFRGWHLSYTSIEGGKADGRRSELSLMPKRIEDGPESGRGGLSNLTEQYVQDVYLLVDTLAKENTFNAGEIKTSRI